MTTEARQDEALFLRLLCDVMIPAELAQAIREQGYDIAEARLLPVEVQQDDDALLEEAARQRRAVLKEFARARLDRPLRLTAGCALAVAYRTAPPRAGGARMRSGARPSRRARHARAPRARRRTGPSAASSVIRFRSRSSRRARVKRRACQVPSRPRRFSSRLKRSLAACRLSARVNTLMSAFTTGESCRQTSSMGIRTACARTPRAISTFTILSMQIAKARIQ